jgi:hypothetical protein
MHPLRRTTALLLTLVIFTGVARAQEPVNVLGLLLAGAATLETTPWDIGSPTDLFDGDTGTLLRSAAVNPMLVTLEFDSPLTIERFRVWFLAGDNAWRVEGAATRADLDAQAGSYRVLCDWRTGPEWSWNEATTAAGADLGAIRLSLQRLSGDDYVHLCEWELWPPDDWFRITDFSWNPVTGQAWLEWGSVAGNWYGVEKSGDLADWELHEFVKADGAHCDWWETLAAPLPEKRFWRVRRAAPEERPQIVKRALVLCYDPLIEAADGLPLHEVAGWNDPWALTLEYLDHLSAASGGYVVWELVDFLWLDEWPLKADGFRYTDQSYLDCLADPETYPWHMPDGVDYEALIAEHQLDQRVAAGEVDEVLLWGGPYFGWYESRMVGATAYWCNSGPIVRPGVPNYVIMGLNYERGAAEALHSFGHRAESILTHVYGSWSPDGTVNHHWDRFTRVQHLHGTLAGVGNIHYPPNGTSDYDYANFAAVLSEADAWLAFPDLSLPPGWVDCQSWGGPDFQLGYLLFWLERLPRAPGRNPDGKLNNWWGYLLDMNEYPESR